MIILGLETSCDETSAAVIEGNPDKKSVKLLSNIVSSSLPLHAGTGGIIPENAAREQLRFMIPVVEQALKESNLYPPSSKNEHLSSTIYRPAIDAIAVTVGPGLIGSLLVGVETAKTLSLIWNKPIIPVNHLIGHIYANFIRANSKFEIRNSKLDARRYSLNAEIEFPAVGLIVSGGHTDLILMREHAAPAYALREHGGRGSIKWLGGTLDDAAGEALDKIGRVLGLPYPGGPAIEQKAKNGNPKAFAFPKPLINADNFDFSFSGLKTAVSRSVILRQKAEESRSFASAQDDNFVADICASMQQSVVDVLVTKTLKAAKKYKAKSILLGGGVTSNQKLRTELELNAKRYTPDAEIFCPAKNLCTDNAAMIAAAALYNFEPKPWSKITANPELYFD